MIQASGVAARTQKLKVNRRKMVKCSQHVVGDKVAAMGALF